MRVSSFLAVFLVALVALVAFVACAGPAAAPMSQVERGGGPSAKGAPVGGSATADIAFTLRNTWAADGITPAPRADDATFFRRATHDITRTIPRRRG